MNDLLKHIGLRIQESVEEKNWTAVEHWAKELLKYAPQKTLGFKWLARASFAQSKLDRAAYAYNRVLDFEPENEEAQRFFSEHAPSNVKTIDAKITEPDLEDNYCSLTPEQKSFLGRAEFEAATAYESVKMYSEAAEHYKKSFFWFSHPQAAYKAAEMYHKSLKSFEAMKLLRETLNANPNWIEGHLLAGNIHFELGQLSSAQNEWQVVLKLDPKNQEALKKLRSTWELEHR